MTNLRELARAAKAAHEGGDLGAFSDAFGEFQRAATPAAILALYAELDEARAERDDLAQSLKQIMVADRDAAEASLSEKEREVERWKALALHLRKCLGEDGDSVWHQVHMSVTPEEALADLKAALTQEPTNAD